jgi:response regulator RpfG family c-di-GMP phosphodiesterase
MEQSPLNECSILVVEDEPLIAMDIPSLFESRGADVTIVSTVHEASQLADEEFSLANWMNTSYGDRSLPSKTPGELKPSRPMTPITIG